MKLSLKRIVNLSIVCAFVGMFISFPFKATFIGGLLFALCSAATIGGLADSFAVSALFGQPLHIRWPRWMGTNIIARNRDRLINELVDMVQDELLSTEMITRQLKNYQASTIITQYAQSIEGKTAIRQLAVHTLRDIIKISHPTVTSLTIKRLLNQGIDQMNGVYWAGKITDWAIAHKADQALIKQLAKLARQILNEKTVQQFIYEFISTAIRSYEYSHKKRQFVNKLAGLDASMISDKIMTIAFNHLELIERGEHALNEKLPSLLIAKLQSVKEDAELSVAWNLKIREGLKYISSYILSEEQISQWKEKLLTAFASEQELQDTALYEWIEKQYDELLMRYIQNDQLIHRTNQYISSLLINLIESNHSYIGKLVREKLEQFDEQQLIALVHEKAGKDLQFIRLNGTLVGALIGAILYLIGFAIGGIL